MKIASKNKIFQYNLYWNGSKTKCHEFSFSEINEIAVTENQIDLLQYLLSFILSQMKNPTTFPKPMGKQEH